MRTILGVVLHLGVISAVAAQESLPPDLVTIADAWTGGRTIPPAMFARLKSWVEPTEPFKIAGPIYYVGTRGLGAYLITTPQGHILLDGGMASSGHELEMSIRKLTLKPEDIRLLLITHAHVDHAGTLAYLKKVSGAPVAVMDRDFEHLKTGGKSDPMYRGKPPFYFPSVTADRVLKDGDTVSVGNVRMTARLGPGHTQGATTWITTIEDGGRTYTVVFPCCTSVNPGFRVEVHPSYEGIGDDYRRTFSMLDSLRPDIWLGGHTETFGFEDKRARAAREGVGAWVDPAGYRTWLAQEKAAFEAIVKKEKEW